MTIWQKSSIAIDIISEKDEAMWLACAEMDSCLRWVGTGPILEYAGCYFIANIKAIPNASIPADSYPEDTDTSTNRRTWNGSYGNKYRVSKSETPMFWDHKLYY